MASGELGAPTVLRLLERYPSAQLLHHASRDDLIALARTSKHRQPARFADKVAAALIAENVAAAPLGNSRDVGTDGQ